MKRKAMVTKQSVDWDACKTSRNRVNIALQRGKSEYYCNKTAQQNKNDLLGRSSSDTTINELSIDGFNITSTQEMANGFDECFTNIDPNLASSIDDSNTSFRLLVKPAKSKFDRIKLASVSRVIKLLNGLSNCKALVQTKYLVEF